MSLTRIFSLALWGLLIAHLGAQPRLQRVAGGFERPVWAGVPPQHPQRMWVMEQAGRIWIINPANGEKSPTPLLDIRELVTRKGNEQGMLGLAFAPDHAKSGIYYVHYDNLDGTTTIARYRTTPDGLGTDPASGEILLTCKQPYSNHNGGWICFGPDGMLYIALGDGGSGNDPQDNGQKLGTLLGKILRIDVSQAGAYRIPADNPFVGKDGVRGEIWAYGLRNPWRCSFDRKTGDLWIGDVGQNAWEEINFMPAGKGSGANYGWRLREGLIETPKKGIGGPKPEPCVDPVHVYAHGSGPMEGLSVTGGYVYRGPIAALAGRYIFADYQQPRLWSLRLENGKAVDLQNHSESWKPAKGNFNLISSFAEDLEGNLYAICLSGELFVLSER